MKLFDKLKSWLAGERPRSNTEIYYRKHLTLCGLGMPMVRTKVGDFEKAIFLTDHVHPEVSAADIIKMYISMEPEKNIKKWAMQFRMSRQNLHRILHKGQNFKLETALDMVKAFPEERYFSNNLRFAKWLFDYQEEYNRLYGKKSGAK